MLCEVLILGVRGCRIQITVNEENKKHQNEHKECWRDCIWNQTETATTHDT